MFLSKNIQSSVVQKNDTHKADILSIVSYTSFVSQIISMKADFWPVSKNEIGQLRGGDFLFYLIFFFVFYNLKAGWGLCVVQRLVHTVHSFCKVTWKSLAKSSTSHHTFMIIMTSKGSFIDLLQMKS